MKVFVIGLGSMGKRRIRLLKENLSFVEVIGIDQRRDRIEEIKTLYSVEAYSNLEILPITACGDAAFICTPPNTHAELIGACLNKNLHVFTEINLISNRHDDLLCIAKNRGLVLFLSSTMLYRKEIEYIQSRVKGYKGEIYYRYHVGQYLPDWHPWENYKDFFVSDRRTNGCRELFAIELPWLIKVFGEIVNFTVKRSKLTGLDLCYPDSFILILEHESGHKGTLQVDVVSRIAVRSLEIIAEELYLTWNGEPDGLMDFSLESKDLSQVQLYDKASKDKRYAANIIEDAYLDEIKAFFEILGNSIRDQRYTMRDEIITLQLIDRFERE